MERWATFDCYGTLIDWDGGVRAELERIFGDEHADELLVRYHEVEPRAAARRQPQLPRGPDRVAAPARRARRRGARARRIAPGWRSFTEVHGALDRPAAARLEARDPLEHRTDYIAASLVQIGVPFDEVVVAQEIGSYKPGHRHWEEFFSRTKAPRAGHVHVAASLYHDVVPCKELGLRCVWINRLGEDAGAVAPTATLTDLFSLPGVLDELVPA